MISSTFQARSRPSRRGRPHSAALAVSVAIMVIAAACSSDDAAISGGDDSFGDPGDCVVVDMSVSSEKIELLSDLAREFNAADRTVSDGTCIFVRPQSKSSGKAATLLAEGWDPETEGPEPVIWSPAAASWGAIVNQRLEVAGESPMTATDPSSFMLTPLVIAMPQPMADALGYPETPVGWSDILALAQDPEGWARYGHPEWGPFRLGKTNPNFSTSGLSALIAQTYAATGATDQLTSEDLADPAVIDFGTGIESAVVHYGDITMTFLNNWFRADRAGTALTYASAVAVEEKSVIDYNRGNPDGIIDPGETPREPRIPLVAIYPSEGTLFSDNPFFVLDAEWVDDAEREAAAEFEQFVQDPENQAKVLDYGFRPGNPEVALGAPIDAANGVDPTQPATELPVPEPAVTVELLDRWVDQRKTARVLLVMDVSGSMGDEAGGGETKLDLATRAADNALGSFKATDEVGLRIFSTDMGVSDSYLDLVPIAPIGENLDDLRSSLASLTPLNKTPLYEATSTSFAEMVAAYDPARINAVLLLTDGKNEDLDEIDDRTQRDQLIAQIAETASGEGSVPVRIFAVAYGADADSTTLQAIAEASNGVVYPATDATTIDSVFVNVVSNF